MDPQTPAALVPAAEQLAIEIHEGKWDHVSGMRWTPAPAIPELIAELQRRAPGFSERVYQEALAEGLQYTR